MDSPIVRKLYALIEQKAESLGPQTDFFVWAKETGEVFLFFYHARRVGEIFPAMQRLTKTPGIGFTNRDARYLARKIRDDYPGQCL